jgi:hypothetical protein
MATRNTPDWRDGERTKPWAPEQFAHVADWPPLVYSVAGELAELRLHLPGGAVLTATAAHSAGLRVRLPRTLRREGPAGREGAG